jgi:hypothetical protein
MRRLHQPGRRGAPDEWGEGFLAGHRPSLPGDYSGGNHPASKGNKGKPSKDKHWDEYVDPEASVGFFRCFLALALEHLKPNSAIYQWHAHRRQALVEQAWTQCRLLVHQQIIWMKARGVLTHSHYLWSHEPCFYGWREGQPPSRKPPTIQRAHRVGARPAGFQHEHSSDSETSGAVPAAH